MPDTSGVTINHCYFFDKVVPFGDKHSLETDMKLANEIRRYKELADEGIITEEEFLQKKKQLLGL
ncbi:SHOCT domain-containing protein [Priestia megaterium]|uniref:SHOCT domain-containing protein n=1 Tax=Priestia megaterium TaxID=1404 RepID=UPI002D80419B|nr:SHOCT domain-containing protein [Priestia megaterium]MEB4869027.1 SHOCT domain-containing protein [Priestia megaterium]